MTTSNNTTTPPSPKRPAKNGLQEFDDGYFLNRPRWLAALEVSWEAQQLSQHLANEIHGDHEGGRLLHLRGMALRIKELGSVLMSALDDDAEPISDLERRIRGVAIPTENGDE